MKLRTIIKDASMFGTMSFFIATGGTPFLSVEHWAFLILGTICLVVYGFSEFKEGQFSQKCDSCGDAVE